MPWCYQTPVQGLGAGPTLAPSRLQGTGGDETHSGNSGAEVGGWIWLLDAILDPQPRPPASSVVLSLNWSSLVSSFHPDGSVYQDYLNDII